MNIIMELADYSRVRNDSKYAKHFEALANIDPTPRFPDWGFERYTNAHVKGVYPMLASTFKDEKIDELMDNPDWYLQHKLNGERCTLHVGSKANRLFSRRISKNGWFNEKTDLLPQLRDFDLSEFRGTVLDGELLHPSGIFKNVGKVLRSLPERAIQLQKETDWLFYVVYDITHWRGFSIQHLPYWKRMCILNNIIYKNGNYRCPSIIPITTVTSGIMTGGEWRTKEGVLRYILENGGEGAMLKDKNAPYEQGVDDYRSKNIGKIKDIKTWDVVICGYDVSLSLYEGKEIENNGVWLHWVDPEKNNELISQRHIQAPKLMLKQGYLPVTKYYAKGWIRAVKYGVAVPFKKLGKLPEPLQNAKVKLLYPGMHIVEIGQSSGMDDYVRKLLSENREAYMLKTIEIKGNSLTDAKTGSIQHPRFVRFREDKSPDQCTWKSHLETGGFTTNI